jgi:hypothetical protein
MPGPRWFWREEGFSVRNAETICGIAKAHVVAADAIKLLQARACNS